MTDAQHAAECIRSRAFLLGNDSVDLAVWARLTGDAALVAAAAQFAQARRRLYARANALLLGADAVPHTETVGEAAT